MTPGMRRGSGFVDDFRNFKKFFNLYCKTGRIEVKLLCWLARLKGGASGTFSIL